MRKILFSALSLLIALLPFSASAKKLHTIGDSTMANYNEESTIKGWGQMLQQFLDGIEVNNRAKSGSSTKSFYNAPEYWASSVQKQISAGDIVLIQFAHNDEKNGGMDGEEVIAYYKSKGDEAKANSTSNIGTNPSTTYKAYLRKYVEDTRKLGAEPILVGPICRKYFTGSTIRRNGRHDLGDSFDKLTASGPVSGQKVAESDHSMDYVYQMKEVAKEMNVPFVDLTTATKELYESYGDSKCTELLF
ncbi:MAG: carbohydrate esterase, partial [Muribaculaceae bacterium]|nr:carbohydrate esterase [Muribaculaceae bacterium]